MPEERTKEERIITSNGADDDMMIASTRLHWLGCTQSSTGLYCLVVLGLHDLTKTSKKKKERKWIKDYSRSTSSAITDLLPVVVLLLVRLRYSGLCQGCYCRNSQ